MFKLLSLAAAIVMAAVTFGGSAVAQSNCGIHANIIMTLDMQYGESRHGIGLSGPGSAFEIWANDETGSWTILKVYPSGQACMMASGEGWTVDPPVPPGKPT